MRALAGQFLSFSLVGVAAAVGHYGVYVLLVLGTPTHPLPASVAGFLVGGVISYLLNYRYTFRSTKQHQEATLKFFVVAACGLLVNTLLMALLLERWHVHWLAAQLLTTAAVLFLTFFGNRLWTFRPRPG